MEGACKHCSSQSCGPFPFRRRAYPAFGAPLNPSDSGFGFKHTASPGLPGRDHLAGATSKAVGAEGDPKIGTREQPRGREGDRCSSMTYPILTSLCLAMPARTPTSRRLQELHRPRSGPPGYLNRRSLGNTWDSRTGSDHEGGWA